MPRIPFEDLPEHGRLWVFPLSRSLSDAERTTVLAEVDAFLAQWAAHGAPLQSGRELRDDRFLLVGVDEHREAPSGCSIDALVNRLRAIGRELEVSFIDHAPVWFVDLANLLFLTSLLAALVGAALPERPLDGEDMGPWLFRRANSTSALLRYARRQHDRVLHVYACQVSEFSATRVGKYKVWHKNDHKHPVRVSVAKQKFRPSWWPSYPSLCRPSVQK